MKLGMAQGELESHSNPNNLVDRSPQHGEKRMRCPSEFEGSSFHPLYMSSVKQTFFVTHDCLRGYMLFCMIHLAMRYEATRRLFLFFVYTFFIHTTVVLIKVLLYVEGYLGRGALN